MTKMKLRSDPFTHPILFTVFWDDFGANEPRKYGQKREEGSMHKWGFWTAANMISFAVHARERVSGFHPLLRVCHSLENDLIWPIFLPLPYECAFCNKFLFKHFPHASHSVNVLHFFPSEKLFGWKRVFQISPNHPAVRASPMRVGPFPKDIRTRLTTEKIPFLE